MTTPGPGRALTVAMVMIDPIMQQVQAKWHYNPDANPLVITVGGLTTPPWEITGVARNVVLSAYEQSPQLVGQGMVRFLVADQATLRMLVAAPGHQVVTYLGPAAAIAAFMRATLETVPVCRPGYCELAECEECRWTRRQVPGHPE